jgi:Ca2+-binding EF-hand superfamily protein
MIKRLLGGAALMAIAAQTPLFAQDAPPPPPGPGMHRPMAMAMPPLTRADAEKRLTERFAAVDLNKDGALTRDEIARARREHGPEAMMKEHRDAEFAALDKDKNGSISRDEFDAARPPMPGMAGMPGMPGMARMEGAPMGDRPMFRRIVIRHMSDAGEMGEGWFDRTDANKDDKVTLAEAKTAALAMFDRADANHDGTITPDERRMTFRLHRSGPGMMPGGPGMMMPPPVKG